MIIITEGGSFSVFAIEVLSVFCINLRNTFAVFNSLLKVSSFLKMFVLALASRRGSNNYVVLFFPQLLFPQP